MQKSILKQELVIINYGGELLYSFDKKSNDKDDEGKEVPFTLRSITGEDIFCPNYGIMNFFEDDFATINRNYFCKNCSVRINVYWEKFAKKQMSVINCEICNQTTFALPKYCIYDGSR